MDNLFTGMDFLWVFGGSVGLLILAAALFIGFLAFLASQWKH
jgi:hypothetical protein